MTPAASYNQEKKNNNNNNNHKKDMFIRPTHHRSTVVIQSKTNNKTNLTSTATNNRNGNSHPNINSGEYNLTNSRNLNNNSYTNGINSSSTINSTQNNGNNSNNSNGSSNTNTNNSKNRKHSNCSSMSDKYINNNGTIAGKSNTIQKAPKHITRPFLPPPHLPPPHAAQVQASRLQMKMEKQKQKQPQKQPQKQQQKQAPRVPESEPIIPPVVSIPHGVSTRKFSGTSVAQINKGNIESNNNNMNNNGEGINRNNALSGSRTGNNESNLNGNSIAQVTPVIQVTQVAPSQRQENANETRKVEGSWDKKTNDEDRAKAEGKCKSDSLGAGSCKSNRSNRSNRSNKSNKSGTPRMRGKKSNFAQRLAGLAQAQKRQAHTISIDNKENTKQIGHQESQQIVKEKTPLQVQDATKTVTNQVTGVTSHKNTNMQSNTAQNVQDESKQHKEKTKAVRTTKGKIEKQKDKHKEKQKKIIVSSSDMSLRRISRRKYPRKVNKGIECPLRVRGSLGYKLFENKRKKIETSKKKKSDNNETQTKINNNSNKIVDENKKDGNGNVASNTGVDINSNSNLSLNLNLMNQEFESKTKEENNGNIKNIGEQFELLFPSLLDSDSQDLSDFDIMIDQSNQSNQFNQFNHYDDLSTSDFNNNNNSFGHFGKTNEFFIGLKEIHPSFCRNSKKKGKLKQNKGKSEQKSRSKSKSKSNMRSKRKCRSKSKSNFDTPTTHLHSKKTQRRKQFGFESISQSQSQIILTRNDEMEEKTQSTLVSKIASMRKANAVAVSQQHVIKNYGKCEIDSENEITSEVEDETSKKNTNIDIDIDVDMDVGIDINSNEHDNDWTIKRKQIDTGDQIFVDIKDRQDSSVDIDTDVGVGVDAIGETEVEVEVEVEIDTEESKDYEIVVPYQVDSSVRGYYPGFAKVTDDNIVVVPTVPIIQVFELKSKDALTNSTSKSLTPNIKSEEILSKSKDNSNDDSNEIDKQVQELDHSMTDTLSKIEIIAKTNATGDGDIGDDNGDGNDIGDSGSSESQDEDEDENEIDGNEAVKLDGLLPDLDDIDNMDSDIHNQIEMEKIDKIVGSNFNTVMDDYNTDINDDKYDLWVAKEQIKQIMSYHAKFKYIDPTQAPTFPNQSLLNRIDVINKARNLLANESIPKIPRDFTRSQTNYNNENQVETLNKEKLIKPATLYDIMQDVMRTKAEKHARLQLESLSESQSQTRSKSETPDNNDVTAILAKLNEYERGGNVDIDAKSSLTGIERLQLIDYFVNMYEKMDNKRQELFCGVSPKLLHKVLVLKGYTNDKIVAIMKHYVQQHSQIDISDCVSPSVSVESSVGSTVAMTPGSVCQEPVSVDLELVPEIARIGSSASVELLETQEKEKETERERDGNGDWVGMSMDDKIDEVKYDEEYLHYYDNNDINIGGEKMDDSKILGDYLNKVECNKFGDMWYNNTKFEKSYKNYNLILKDSKRYATKKMENKAKYLDSIKLTKNLEIFKKQKISCHTYTLRDFKRFINFTTLDEQKKLIGYDIDPQIWQLNKQVKKELINYHSILNPCNTMNGRENSSKFDSIYKDFVINNDPLNETKNKLINECEKKLINSILFGTDLNDIKLKYNDNDDIYRVCKRRYNQIRKRIDELHNLMNPDDADSVDNYNYTRARSTSLAGSSVGRGPGSRGGVVSNGYIDEDDQFTALMKFYDTTNARQKERFFKFVEDCVQNKSNEYVLTGIKNIVCGRMIDDIKEKLHKNKKILQSHVNDIVNNTHKMQIITDADMRKGTLLARRLKQNKKQLKKKIQQNSKHLQTIGMDDYVCIKNSFKYVFFLFICIAFFFVKCF